MPGFRKKIKQLFKPNSKAKSPQPAPKYAPSQFPQGTFTAPPPLTLNPLSNLKSLSLAPAKPKDEVQNTQPVTTNRKSLLEVAREGDLAAVQERLSEHQRAPEEIHKVLMAAANCGQGDVLLLLLQQDGIDVNTQNVQGHSALHRAVHGGHGWAVRVLMENGADPFLGSPSPIEWAEDLWNARPLTLFRELVDERYPGRREELMTLRRRGEKTNKKEARAVKEPVSTARAPPSQPQEHTKPDVKGKGGELWPDRILIRKGKKTVIQPSDPTYWN